MALNPGEVIVNRYKIVKKLGEGGFGAVYLAEDLNLREKHVALKINLWNPSSPISYKQAAAQFELEALMLATLSHPNLPRVTDYQPPANNKQFFVMDYIPGESIQARITRDGAMDESSALSLIDQVFDALKYLHAQNPPVIHRDIKPDNIIITPSGKAFLVDFGISKINQTLSGARGTSPCYSPPEQYGTGTDPRSDVYAAGATLYFILTGTPPSDSIARMVGVELKSPNVISPHISPNFNDAILQAMSLQMDQRYQSVSELQHALAQKPGRLQTIRIGSATSPVKELVVNRFSKEPGEFRTIQAALDASEGEIKRIVVRGGTYSEYLTITGNVSIRGEDQPVFRSPGDQPAIRIREGSLIVEGVNFEGNGIADCCIEQQKGTVNLNNCRISRAKVSCILAKGGVITLEHCELFDSILLNKRCDGLILYDLATAYITNSHFKDLGTGIRIYESSHIEITGCQFSSNIDNGVSALGANEGIFKDCNFDFNRRVGLFDVSGNVILVVNCTFTGNGKGVQTGRSATTKFIRCQFRNNNTSALCIEQSTPEFEACIFFDKGITKKDDAKPTRS